MRQNPTAATGPVSIKHVRNTVPKALAVTNAPPATVTLTAPQVTSGTFYPANLQLEEPTL